MRTQVMAVVSLEVGKGWWKAVGLHAVARGLDFSALLPATHGCSCSAGPQGGAFSTTRQ
jgi:hypothetical protein